MEKLLDALSVLGVARHADAGVAECLPLGQNPGLIKAQVNKIGQISDILLCDGLPGDQGDKLVPAVAVDGLLQQRDFRKEPAQRR